MKIVFKNVNQGDTIFIEWNVAGCDKFGMIDCHSEYGNQAIKYLDRNKQIKEIEFVIISHPHFDHFSGILDLLKYCSFNKIKINEIGFTFDNTISYAYADLAYSKAKGLLDFFEFITTQSRLKEVNRTIKHSFAVNSDTKTKSFGEFKLDFLRPLNIEIMNLGKSIGKLLANKIQNEPDFNLYSSVIEISKNNKSFLFTSDAPKKAFKSLIKYYSNKIHEFHLVQIPHHGSIGNHELKFWQTIKKVKNCPAVFSVGDEPKDELPDFEVVNDINSLGYVINSTNTVYGISEYLSIKPKRIKPLIMQRSAKVIKVNTLSVAHSPFVGDKSFNF